MKLRTPGLTYTPLGDKNDNQNQIRSEKIQAGLDLGYETGIVFSSAHCFLSDIHRELSLPACSNTTINGEKKEGRKVVSLPREDKEIVSKLQTTQKKKQGVRKPGLPRGVKMR